MTLPEPLTPDEIAAARETLHDDWEMFGGKLHRELSFESFPAAFGFMTTIALVAQEMGHHPDWFNQEGNVVIDVVTHDIGDAMSEMDFKLALAIDRAAA